MNITDGLNANQKSAVLETEGPILIIAGPGSGKTLTLVRRTLHIIQSGLAQPHEIILCSFTEKSAHELKERIASNAQDLGITQDLSSLVIGTIHSICAAIIEDNLERANLGKNYDVLDDVTKLLFIHQNFEEIVGLESETGTFIEGKYKSKWSAIKGLSKYFDKISDELINARDLLRDSNPVTAAIAIAYLKYLELLVANNKVDFAHLQVKALDVLTSKTDSSLVLPKYVMIDEFQDTNFVQERLVSLLAESSGNLCVVGDEDQSLYRFRGATVENILSFPESRPDTKIFELDINYRSEPRIVKLYKDFMESGTWTKDGNKYRFSKHLEPADYEETTYPSVYLNNALDPDDEAIRNAKFIRSLKDSGFIGDYSEVAILLRSVREQHSLPFRAALASEGIKSFCPRAKTFFRNEEVGLIFASLAHILGREDNPNSKGKAWDLNMYLRSYAEELLDLAQLNPALEDILRKSRESVLSLAENQTMDKRAVDFLFDLLAAEPFRSWMLETERARNIAQISKYLTLFHQYYGFSVITGKSLIALRGSFFNSFLAFLLEGGADEFEDSNLPFPSDHVQIMTIHQAKGLEFPVIISGSLDHRGKNDNKEMLQALDKYMARKLNEPQDMVAEFDSMRLFYVAFSRAKDLLVLSGNQEAGIHSRFDAVLGQPTRLELFKPSLSAERSSQPARIPLTKTFSFTSDIQAFETCKRQYKLFNVLEFSPSRAVTILFGTLVHQTIEDIHKAYLDGKGSLVDEKFIESKFDFNYRMLQLKEVRFIADAQKNVALKHVTSYWRENLNFLQYVYAAEVEVSINEAGYILNGTIDLINVNGEEIEIVDFKTGSRPDSFDSVTQTYYQQLCIYAHILEKRTGLRASRLVLYWTGELERDKARMVFDFVESDIATALNHFEAVVKSIQGQNFEMERAPDKKICNECDFKNYCKSTGLIRTQ